ncbi:hypothetical protein GCM10022215_23950 [Nocardioides fonticola]|uniref:Uncharacterized protein n=1 Tax=Nocardioides fonticola TaxID=450363 RepID=A0ABP7XJP4_9ACTN
MGSSSPPGDTELTELTELIVDALRADGYYTERVVDDEDRVAAVRRCGRRAGRLLGRSVQTLAVRSPSGRVAEVHVIDRTEPHPEDELAHLQMQRRMRAAIKSLSV